MKKRTTLILITILFTTFIQIFGQSKTTTNQINNNSIIRFADTLNIRIGDKSQLLPEIIKIKDEKSFNLLEQMPWIVALVIGFISYMIGRGQIDIQRNLMTSVNRQQWINTLREDISNYLGKIEHYSVIISTMNGDKERLIEFVQDKIQQEIYSLNIKIVLLLNPNDNNSKQLIELLSKYTKSVFGEHDGNLTQEEIKQKILDISKQILNIEWEKIKKSKE